MEIHSLNETPAYKSLKNRLIVILGPTAVGKTQAAVRVASEYNGEIISADSRQVYRGMDIGTGKDLSDYVYEGKRIPYHLIDICNPEDDYNLYKFRIDFLNAYNDITSRVRMPILAGGSSMYLDSVIRNYTLRPAKEDEEKYIELHNLPIQELREKLIALNPGTHNITDMLDKARIIQAIRIADSTSEALPLPVMDIRIFGITLPLPDLRKRITERLGRRLETGMIEETERLIASGVTHERLRFFGLEYKFISLYLLGDLNYNDMKQKLGAAIYEFARKQLKWFRKMEREGVYIEWLDSDGIITGLQDKR